MISLSVIRRSLSLKISISLACLIAILTVLAGYVITARQVQAMAELTINKAKLAAALGAKAYAVQLEDGVDSAYLSINDLFDKNYQEIKGYDWGGKPKYHSKFDFFTDERVLVFQDTFLDSEDFIYAVGSDSSGYVPTHNTRYQQRLTGDPAKDLVGNRTKRMFTDEVGSKAATSTDPVLVQFYRRDTGAQAWDVSVPIEVKGKHWGAFRVGVSVDEIEKHKHALIATLTSVFLLFALTSVGTIFFLIRRAIAPLNKLSALADELSTGEQLDVPIKPASVDEVGRMAKSLDRLRVSLKAAMSRIGE